MPDCKTTWLARCSRRASVGTLSLFQLLEHVFPNRLVWLPYEANLVQSTKNGITDFVCSLKTTLSSFLIFQVGYSAVKFGERVRSAERLSKEW